MTTETEKDVYQIAIVVLIAVFITLGVVVKSQQSKIENLNDELNTLQKCSVKQQYADSLNERLNYKEQHISYLTHLLNQAETTRKKQRLTQNTAK